MMTERSFRRNLKSMGYTLRKRGGRYTLIDTETDTLIVEGKTMPEIAEIVALRMGFPKIY